MKDMNNPLVYLIIGIIITVITIIFQKEYQTIKNNRFKFLYLLIYLVFLILPIFLFIIFIRTEPKGNIDPNIQVFILKIVMYLSYILVSTTSFFFILNRQKILETDKEIKEVKKQIEILMQKNNNIKQLNICIL
jgi:CDP-diglyceride synthetase